jgi:hypothetical protein
VGKGLISGWDGMSSRGFWKDGGLTS